MVCGAWDHRITHDPLRRLGLTIYGPGTHIEKEALYYSALPVGGTPLSGANTYRLTFATGDLPPVEAFWSLIMYAPNNELIANPINRYELASHNPTDLNYASDGSLTITISNTQPRIGHRQLAASARRTVPDDPAHLPTRDADRQRHLAATRSTAGLKHGSRARGRGPEVGRLQDAALVSGCAFAVRW